MTTGYGGSTHGPGEGVPWSCASSEAFARIGCDEAGELRLACIAATMEHFLSRVIASGEVELTSVVVVPQVELEEQLVHNTADVAILLAPAPAPFRSVPIRRLHVSVQLPPELDRWAPDEPVMVHDLVDVPFVALTRRSPSRQRLEEAAAADDLVLAPEVETEHASVLQAIAAHRGMACIATEERPAHGFGWHPLHSAALGCLNVLLYLSWDPEHFMQPAILELAQRFRATGLASAVALPGCRPAIPKLSGTLDQPGQPEPA